MDQHAYHRAIANSGPSFGSPALAIACVLAKKLSRTAVTDDDKIFIDKLRSISSWRPATRRTSECSCKGGAPGCRVNGPSEPRFRTDGKGMFKSIANFAVIRCGLLFLCHAWNPKRLRINAKTDDRDDPAPDTVGAQYRRHRSGRDLAEFPRIFPDDT